MLVYNEDDTEVFLIEQQKKLELANGKENIRPLDMLEAKSKKEEG